MIAAILTLARFYSVGVVNTLFAFLVYAGLVTLGVNLFVAQLLATVIGVAFNYVTYSRLVFTSSRPSRLRFIASYVVNYLLSLASLYVFHRLVSSALLAGALSLAFTSAINFVLLKRFVFREPAA
jgi:putative flippase GtrA